MRKIGDKKFNEFVASGVEAHKATQTLPDSLSASPDEQVVAALAERQQEAEAALVKSVGKPAFSAPGFLLYCGDSLELLPRFAEVGIKTDLTVTSPPYNIGKAYENERSVEDYVNWCSEWMASVHKVATPTGAFWLNVGYLEVPGQGLCVPIPYLLWDKSPFYLLQEIVWQYGAGVAAKRRLSPRNEKWLFYVVNPLEYTFNLDDIRDPNVKYPNQRKNGKFRCNPLGKNPSDVWSFPKVTTGEKRKSKERTGHPAQFPLRVVERVIRASSNPLDLVLDPFAGSCSAGVAAASLGRLFIGIEVRSDYCDIAAERWEQIQSDRRESERQGALFSGI